MDFHYTTLLPLLGLFKNIIIQHLKYSGTLVGNSLIIKGDGYSRRISKFNFVG